MSGILLVAASGLAREVLAVIRATAPSQRVRVLDDDPALWDTKLDGADVVGGLEEAKRYDDAAIVVCAGRGAARRHIVARLAALGVEDKRYARVIHPGVDIPASCTVGQGSILLAQVAITADVKIGRHVVVMPHVTLTHDDVVEDYATLCAGATLGGSVRVGSGAYVGMNASVRERVRVGADSVLGMGAVLLRDLPRQETWVGVPAQAVTTREKREL